MTVETIKSAEVSDRGRKRQANEDSCLRIPTQGVYCVADGMGGIAGGDIASEAVTRAIGEVFTEAAPETTKTLGGLVALFTKAAAEANGWIKAFSMEKGLGQMGSTVVGLVLDPTDPSRGVALHAGDSRAYRYHASRLELLTSDHSAVAALAAKLGRDPSSFPAKYQNELVRAVGLQDTVELEHTAVDVHPGDIFMLCSDGLTRMLEDDEILEILQRGSQASIEAKAQSLVDAANEAGGKDNITVVLVQIPTGASSGEVPAGDDEAERETLVAPRRATEIDSEAPTRLPLPCPPVPTPSAAPLPALPKAESEPAHLDETPTVVRKEPSAPTPTQRVKDQDRDTPAEEPPTRALPPAKPSAKPSKTPSRLLAAAALLLVLGLIAWDLIPNSRQSNSSPVMQPAAAKSSNPSNDQAASEAAGLAQSQELERLIDATSKLIAAKEYAQAIESADRGLAIRAGDPRVLAAKQRAQVLRSNVEATKLGVRQAQEKGDLPTASRLLVKALDTDPGHPMLLAMQKEVNNQQEIESSYRLAMANATKGLNERSYTQAIEQASNALSKRPNDAQATKIKSEATRLLANLQTASESARKSLARREPQEALELLNRALSVDPANPTLEGLKGEASRLAHTMVAEQSYESSLRAARKALEERSYLKVIELTKVALGTKPEDPAAIAIKAKAEQALVQITKTESEYSAAIAESRNYLSNNNLLLSKEKAELALALKPGDSEANRLLQDIVIEGDYVRAVAALDSGSYEEAEKLAASHLAKPRFASLSETVGKERRLLKELQSLRAANNRAALDKRLAEPAVVHVANKPSFRELAAWVASVDPISQNSNRAATAGPSLDGKASLEELDRSLESLLQEFEVQLPKGFKPRTDAWGRIKPLPNKRARYDIPNPDAVELHWKKELTKRLALLKSLESAYQLGDQLDSGYRRECIKLLNEKMPKY